MNREDILNFMNNRKQNCNLEILEIATGERTILKTFDKVVEAPNWSVDNKFLVYNCDGLIYKFDLETKESTEINTEFADLCNNDHVLSADGKEVAISHFNLEQGTIISKIYILPIEGGTPKCVTEVGPSYLHGWSPDGKELCYCAMRDESFSMGNIFSIDRDGKKEIRLTNGAWHDDGCEYDNTGEKIWFNSTRSGLMQVWNMNKDGSNPKQITDIEKNCWFPHVSPNGNSVVYLAYKVEDLKPEEHVADKDVHLRIMDIDGQNDRILTELHGGQGTINVNSWSPDCKYIAFVSYF